MRFVVWLKIDGLNLIVGENVEQFEGLPNCLALSHHELDLLLWQIGHQRWFGRDIPIPLPVEHLRAIAAVKMAFPGARVDDLLADILGRRTR